MPESGIDLAPWEKSFERILLPLEEFIQRQTTSGMLGGIGFTMSIFIADLGFANHQEELLMAKTGILFASLVAGIGGFTWLALVTRQQS